MKYKSYVALALFTTFLNLISCKEKDKGSDPSPVKGTDTIKTGEDTVIVKKPVTVSDIIEVNNLQAGRKAIYGGTSEGHYTLFSFKDNAIIPLSDSATTKWDIGFNQTTIIVNSGTSGPGTVTGQVVVSAFDDLAVAPATGYKKDNSAAVTKNAIPTGTDKGWYNYNLTTHVISAIAGRVLVFRTNEGNYVKMRVVSYYKDKILPTVVEEDVDDNSRYYSFRYAYQPDGSINFK